MSHLPCWELRNLLFSWLCDTRKNDADLVGVISEASDGKTPHQTELSAPALPWVVIFHMLSNTTDMMAEGVSPESPLSPCPVDSVNLVCDAGQAGCSLPLSLLTRVLEYSTSFLLDWSHRSPHALLWSKISSLILSCSRPWHIFYVLFLLIVPDA